MSLVFGQQKLCLIYINLSVNFHILRAHESLLYASTTEKKINTIFRKRFFVFFPDIFLSLSISSAYHSLSMQV